VLIADDHDLVREALVMALNTDQALDVVSVGALDEVKRHLSKNGPIDVVLLDLVMPGLKGLPSVQEVVTLNAEGAVALFSGNVVSGQVQEVLKLGCMGVIPKTLPLRSLANAIKLVADGEVFVPVSLSSTKTQLGESNKSLLSGRENSILQFVSQGLTNKEIAWQLSVSEVTIKANMRSICSKLNAKNRASAVINARNAGFI
ncbi:MAG: response regulator transcription factor, partial [Pseudomonadales bacterium]